MLTVFLVLILLYAIAVLIATVPYWYETPNSPCKDIPAPRLGVLPMLRLWWSAFCSFGWILLAHPLNLMLPWLKPDKEPDLPEREYPPLLLVHGLYHNATGWAFLRRHLQHAGFTRIHSYSYCSFGTNVTRLTNRLEQEISALENRYPGEPVLLVGHSLGGVLIRNWLAAAPGNQKRARGILTLGAPHKGSKMAAFACGELGRSVSPSNPFFSELARAEPKAVIPCLALASEADTMVLPQENLVPVTPGWDFRLTPYCTHVGLLTSSAVARMIAWELHRMSAATDGAKTDAPSPAQVASASVAEKNITAPVTQAAQEKKPLAQPQAKTAKASPPQSGSAAKVAAKPAKKAAASAKKQKMKPAAKTAAKTVTKPVEKAASAKKQKVKPAAKPAANSSAKKKK